jgi:hypothetical protein
MATGGIELFILGAGCSVAAGYPSATTMLSGLEAFGQTLNDEAERVRGCVERAVALMHRLNVPTIDELAHRLHHGRGDDPEIGSVEASQQRYKRIAEAKIAVSAYFESLEKGAASTGLPSYHNFFHRIIPSELGRHYQDQLARSKARILSFNYDRLFEIAFCQHVKVDPNMAFYGQAGLNSGVNAFHNETLEFDDNRFSFLKLHGSVGMFAHEDNWGLQIIHSNPSPDGSAGVKDTSYFYTKGPELNKPMWSLMFFPHEKEYLLGKQETAFPYRKYAKQVWARAETVAQAATEIWLVGYSVGETDLPYTLRLLRAAKNADRIVIQGPHPAGIVERLKARAPDLRSKIEGYQQTF